MKKQTTLVLIVIIITLFFVNKLVIGGATPEQAASIAQVINPAGAGSATGEALVGGQFSLTDQDGKKFTEENLKGKYSLIFFGFTHCPDVCPTALSSMSLATHALGEEGKDIKDFQIVFITTDPERDTQAVIKEYLASFQNLDGSLFGLTGTRDEIAKAESAYKVYAEKMKADAKGEYNISHSSIIYIMDKNGKFLSHMNHETKVDDMVAKLKTLN